MVAHEKPDVYRSGSFSGVVGRHWPSRPAGQLTKMCNGWMRELVNFHVDVDVIVYVHVDGMRRASKCI